MQWIQHAGSCYGVKANLRCYNVAPIVYYLAELGILQSYSLIFEPEISGAFGAINNVFSKA